MHMQAEHLELYALGELSEDLAGIVESHLKECVACGIQFEESRVTIGQWVALEDAHRGRERRRSPRTATNDPAVLIVLKPELSTRTRIRILDASKEGLKLEVPHGLMRGMVVQVNVRDLFILAEVRHCRAYGTGFHAGVLIQDVFPAAG